MSEVDDAPEPVFHPNVWYQLLIVHDKQGAGIDAPLYDLGWFLGNEGLAIAVHIGGAAIQAGYTAPYEGEVTNILQAWASLDYRVWFLPNKPSLPCLEYRDQTIVVSTEDPR